ncbi:hypothetical protein SLS63_010819 [Diaporthe eres]|uniref:MAPEG family protein n=1 Tax=Diaporthe eres TaxID=83184 RepID=A0ABR1NVU3_DIAER
MVLLDISNDYGYVLLAAASTVFVNIWHGTQTVKARKASRAHANFTENLTPFMATLLIAGTRYPVQAAVMGAGWLVSRIVYTAGYTSNGPKGRMA